MNCLSGFFNIKSRKCIDKNIDYRTIADLAKDAGDSLVNKGIEGFGYRQKSNIYSKYKLIRIGFNIGIILIIIYIIYNINSSTK